MGDELPYYLPNFNLTFGVWHWPNNPSIGGPDDTQPCQLRCYKKDMQTSSNESFFTPRGLLMHLLCPATTDVRWDPTATGKEDVVEVPRSSGRYYIVQYVDDVAKGFPNEYRIAALSQSVAWPWPVPYP